MYEKLDRSGADVRGYEVRGELTDGELNEIVLDLEEAIEAEGSVNVLVSVPEFPWPDLGAFEEDVAFWLEHGDDIDKYAIVGDGRILEWGTTVSDRVTDIEIRHFESDEIDDAWAWLREE